MRNKRRVPHNLNHETGCVSSRESRKRDLNTPPQTTIKQESRYFLYRDSFILFNFFCVKNILNQKGFPRVIIISFYMCTVLNPPLLSSYLRYEASPLMFCFLTSPATSPATIFAPFSQKCVPSVEPATAPIR